MNNDKSPKLDCEITLLPKSPEGWGLNFVPILTGNTYRPHFVVGDPNQRKPILTTRSHEVQRTDGSKLKLTTDKWVDEEYLGVAFHAGPEIAQLGQPILATVALMYWP